LALSHQSDDEPEKGKENPSTPHGKAHGKPVLEKRTLKEAHKQEPVEPGESTKSAKVEVAGTISSFLISPY